MRDDLPRIAHRIFPATLEELESMFGWVQSRLDGAVLLDGDRRRIELAMEEALVNVIFHAYSPRARKKAILEIIIHYCEDKSMAFKILDKGEPFNPLSRIVHPHMLSGLDREEGGMGIFFIRCCMDEVYYERRHPFNILTLIKRSHR
jgi:anti-sigma regulatory factor (Ser/Thr protein kinase)